jgi:hypothetical protein
MNLAATIIPKSDQLNADDLIAGPRTIRITEVRQLTGEQPVAIHYEGDNGRPYKPGKSMRRVLVTIWGDDSAAYIGRRLTLYRDPSIKFGGDDVGGIRISHASHIAEPHTMALTVTRGKRKPYRVDVLADQSSARGDEPDAATLEAIGDTKARQGSTALREWWESVPRSRVKTALGTSALPTWKQLAADADAAAEGSAQ